jgi:hypothetical protein
MPKSTFAHRPATRDGIQEDGRQTLARLCGRNHTVHVVLVALTDGVELAVCADGALRRRSRFRRDSEARKYGERFATRLARRGDTRNEER